jgi:predicted ATPase with chaperone activity
VARVARTVADLAGDERVTAEHVADALSLRRARTVVAA